MYEANKALSYFVTHFWNFENQSFVNQIHYLKPEDRREFDYKHFFTYDVILYIRATVYGFRKYLLNLEDADLERDRKNLGKIKFFVQIFKIFLAFLIFSIIYVRYW